MATSLVTNRLPKNGFACLPNQALDRMVSFLGIKSLSTIQAVDKQTQAAAKRALEQFVDPVMYLESNTCSRLLTDSYHTLAQKQNSLKTPSDVSTVSVSQEVFILKSSSQQLFYRYTADPQTLSKFKKQLAEGPLSTKFRYARFLMQKAISSNPPIFLEMPFDTDLLRGANLGSYFVNNVVKHGDMFFKIQHVTTRNDKDSTTFIIQASPIAVETLSPTEAYYRHRRTFKTLETEIRETAERANQEAAVILAPFKEKEARQRGGTFNFDSMGELNIILVEAIVWNSADKMGMNPQKIDRRSCTDKEVISTFKGGEAPEASQKDRCILQ